MSICWDCQKKNGCETLYLNGEQQHCEQRDKAYESFENYIQWLAKPNNFNADYLTVKGGQNV